MSLARTFALGLGLASAVAAPGGAAALPLISEVFYDAVGSDDGQSFIELYGVAGASLAGLVLEGVNGTDGAVGPTLALAGSFGPDGFFVVADAASGGGTLVADADLVLNFDLQNGPDSIVLRLESSVLDALGYGVFAAGEVFAGEGSAAPDPPAGSSLARVFADLDTDDNAADFAGLAAPTPGTGPLSGSVPEPAALPLACVALAFARRGSGSRRRRS